MSQSHTPLVPIKLGDSSKAAYALSGATVAIVFLHGYGGTSVGTWKRFDSILFDFPSAENVDLFFIGYRSMTRTTDANASSFVEILDALSTKATASRRPSSIPGDRVEPYTKIVVVAHSMGSVVVRRALLMADENQLAWTKNVAMVFFAPAHLGARFHNHLDSTVVSIFKLIWEFGQFLSPAINELRVDSQYLKELQDQVKKALETSPLERHLVAKRVIHGLDDIIVDQPGHSFCEDPPSIFIPGNHTKLCKPVDAKSPASQQLRIFLEEWA